MQTARNCETTSLYPVCESCPSEGLPRLAYLGPWAQVGTGEGGFRGFSAFRRPHKGAGPKIAGKTNSTNFSFGPWAQGPRSGKFKISKSTSALEQKSTDLPDGPDQSVSSRRYEGSNFGTGLNVLGPQNEEELNKRLQTTNKLIPPSIHHVFFP